MRQVAKRLNVSVSWVQDHASGRCRPILPSFKLGHAVRFKASEIEAFLERCKRATERGASSPFIVNIVIPSPHYSSS